jgi:fatty acid desaturase
MLYMNLYILHVNVVIMMKKNKTESWYRINILFINIILALLTLALYVRSIYYVLLVVYVVWYIIYLFTNKDYEDEESINNDS